MCSKNKHVVGGLVVLLLVLAAFVAIGIALIAAPDESKGGDSSAMRGNICSLGLTGTACDSCANGFWGGATSSTNLTMCWPCPSGEALSSVPCR